MHFMKKRFFVLTLLTLFVGAGLTSCQEPTPKQNEAENKVEEAKEELKAVNKEADENAHRVATAQEWTAFREQTEAKISANEKRIIELKANMKKPGILLDSDYAKMINDLEAKNIQLKRRLENYEKNQSDWEAFRVEFNHDMDELGKALKDLTVNNKK